MSIQAELEKKTPAGFIRRPNPVIKAFGAFHAGIFFTTKDNGLQIMVTEEVHDGLTFLHLTVARKSKYPTYEEIFWVREAFIGKDKQVLQVFPKQKEHVNEFNYCLHLWYCYDKELFPSQSTMETV